MAAEAGPEQGWLPERAGLAALLADGGWPDGPGAWDWIERPGPDGVGDVALCAVRDVVWYPATGLALRGGIPLFSPSHQMWRAKRGSLGRVTERLDHAALWQSPGGLKNYGHFLFDGMTGLAAMDASDLLGAFPPVSAAPLAWQRDLLAAAGLGSGVARGPVAIKRAVYTTAMNSYLNRAGALVPALAARLGRGAAGKGAVYLSRRGYSGRILVNEAALEAALSARGVVVIRPERLSVAQQLGAVRAARVLIGASGAGLANGLVLPEGGAVVELCPERVDEPWMRLTTAALGLTHHAVPLADVTGRAVPLWARARQAPRAMTGRYHYCVRADIDAVLRAVGTALG